MREAFRDHIDQVASGELYDSVDGVMSWGKGCHAFHLASDVASLLPGECRSKEEAIEAVEFVVRFWNAIDSRFMECPDESDTVLVLKYPAVAESVVLLLYDSVLWIDYSPLEFYLCRGALRHRAMVQGGLTIFQSLGIPVAAVNVIGFYLSYEDDERYSVAEKWLMDKRGVLGQPSSVIGSGRSTMGRR